MSTKIRLCLTAVILVATFALVYTSGASSAQGPKDLQETVKSIADELKKGNAVVARNQAVVAAKGIEDVDDLMYLYKSMNLTKRLKNPNVNNAQEIGNLTAALAELTLAMPPAKDGANGKTKKAWAEFSEQTRAAGLQLAKANNANAVAAAAVTIHKTCNACHSKFKD